MVWLPLSLLLFHDPCHLVSVAISLLPLLLLSRPSGSLILPTMLCRGRAVLCLRTSQVGHVAVPSWHAVLPSYHTMIAFPSAEWPHTFPKHFDGSGALRSLAFAPACPVCLLVFLMTSLSPAPCEACQCLLLRLHGSRQYPRFCCRGPSLPSLSAEGTSLSRLPGSLPESQGRSSASHRAASSLHHSQRSRGLEVQTLRAKQMPGGWRQLGETQKAGSKVTF